MRHYNAHHNEDGFTLLELMVVMLFVGIIMAISAPSFLALNRRNQLNQDLTSTENALLEAQRGAMRRGKTCQLVFTTGTTPTISSTSDSGNCLSTGTRTLNNVSMTISTSKTSAPSATNTKLLYRCSCH